MPRPDPSARFAFDPVPFSLQFWSAYYGTCADLAKVTQLWLERRQQALQAALSELHARTDGPANMIAVLAQHNKGWADDLTHLSREASSIQCAYAETVTRIMTEKIDIPPPPGPASPGVPRRDGS